MLTLNGNCRKQILTVLRKVSMRDCINSRYSNTKWCSNNPIDFTVPAGTPGQGAGKGGGSGGSIREAGGGLGRLGAALEEGYFHQHNKEQLKQIKKKLQRGEPISHSDKPPK
ncbi:hypothetical protein PYW07_006352 [Mythimna separata]|uniref:Uncharacterized protein n=1 Tax=Mythimna separata TaxID=271217 RepID=A0AAD7YUC3_MYTSE|nr:hypothetical protein PYW07_006352 [Mythimna separata]